MFLTFSRGGERRADQHLGMLPRRRRQGPLSAPSGSGVIPIGDLQMKVHAEGRLPMPHVAYIAILVAIAAMPSATTVFLRAWANAEDRHTLDILIFSQQTARSLAI